MAKGIRFKLTPIDGGQPIYWTIYREPRVFAGGGNAKRYTGPLWMLRDHEGTERGLEPTWLDSVPLVLLAAENHGCACNLS